ncbi:MAG: alanine--tRNA ligase, partial [Actinomycetota bacterium]|nr:alanine--tRNA ligase [Actinomycetota bacterium]
MVRSSDELREGFLSFFESNGHVRRPSASLVPPPEDPSTLFIVAGMQPLKPFFLGLREPPGPRLVTAQKVMRAGGKQNDLDDVGTTARHLSFFEMLGNFSFGDYFKDGAIDLAWEFVTERMGFPSERLWASVFAGDPELRLGEDEVAIAGWERVGIPRDRIVGLPRVENFWQAADTGPCGPCSELHFDRGEAYGCGRPDCGPGCSCDRFLEFWNLVFMEFDLHADGTLSPLPKQNIDTGLGLERGAMLLQDVDSVFETDAYRPLVDWVAAESGVGYGESEDATKAHRVLADHARAMAFLVADGVIPSNEARGYVLRRIIRRAVQHGGRLGLEAPFLARLAGVVVDRMEGAYPELREHRAQIEETLSAEEARFAETLARGMRVFEEVAAGSRSISGEDAFRLHDTYGFPLELTRELGEERGLAVDEDGFARLMAEQRERSRTGAAGTLERAAEFARAAGFSTEFVGYEKTDVLTQIGALEPLDDGTFLAKLRESPFYAEGGGQVTDQGWIEKDGVRADLVAAYRFGDDQVLALEGEGFEAGDRVRAVVPWKARFPTMANHTATHLLHEALREVLGSHVRQAGSAVRPDKLRFDFTHPQALTPDERARVEGLVNERIFESLPVHAFETPIEEARRLGAMMLFGEKYGDVVRVVEVPDVSRELCGGTHVRSTAEIGLFTIVSESSVGAGVRRIEAVTSGAAFAYLRAQAEQAEALRVELEQVRKEAKRRAPAADTSPDVVENLLAEAKEAGGIRVIAGEVGEMNADALLDLSDRIKQKAAPAAVVLGAREDGRAHLVANFHPAVSERGVSASDIVKAAAGLVGGGGGGRATMA